ncbi:MAG: NAD-dependent epimerase/dehydratase family protein [Bacteroidetes bacterium]|nr:MAG: NAD-dependent epimerase/dehydratase family protein [Bacteroidota bacterium]
MKAIIWGADGQDGFYLDALLKQQGYEVIPVTKEDAGTISISDYSHVSRLIKQSKPDFIFHLAANSTTQHYAWQENHEIISTGTLNILESVKEYSPSTKIFLSGSGLQFKNTGQPVSETDPFDASSIYSVSRIHTVYAARYYRQLGIKSYVGYFFNHDSPLRSERHINKKIIEAAKRIAGGSKEKLEIGDWAVKKEFGYAGDIVKGIWALVQQDKAVEAMIGTGKAHAIEEWLEICFSLQGLNWRDHVVQNKGFIPEYEILVSNPTLINSIGWKHETDIKTLAKMMS